MRRQSGEEHIADFSGGLSVELASGVIVYEVGYLLDCSLREFGEFAVSEESSVEGMVFLVFGSLVAGIGIGIESAYAHSAAGVEDFFDCFDIA